jgi:hypothetical protein
MTKYRLAFAVAIAALGTPSLAMPDENYSGRETCQEVGSGNMENIGDRENHAIQVGTYSCIVETGPLKGALNTGSNVIEWDNGVGNVISGGGIVRAPGTIVVYKVIQAKINLVFENGKVTGWTGGGKNAVALATGAAAQQMTGKTISWTGKGIAFGRFVADDTAE